MRPSNDAAAIEIGLDDAGRGHELRVPGDGAGHPVDVGRLERGDLAERVPVELPELHRVLAREVERRRLGAPEVAEPAAFERTGRGGRPRRLLADLLPAHRGLAGRMGAARAWGAPVPTGGLIALPERAGHVDPAGDRAAGPRPGRATPALGAVPTEVGALAGPRSPVGLGFAGEGRVGIVDLGHTTRGCLGGGRVVAGQVRMVRPGEPAPGCLDLGRGGAAFDAEDHVRIALCHTGQCTGPVRRHFGSLALDRLASVPSPRGMSVVRRAGVAAAIAAAPLGLAYRFALAYRARAGYPRQHPPVITPADLGLAYETTTVRSGDLELPAWFIPARGGAPGPGVALVHGWESARDRTLPYALFLHAAGFHILTIDIRGHGANPAETLPVSGGEFGLDALATFEALLARDEVTVGAIAGHSMGAIGAILAGAADPRVAAIVATAAPADPYRLTRQTFHLARLPIPDPIAYPLAWLTTRVFLRPRRHTVRDISATRAIARYRGPVLLAHGAADQVVPVGHLRRLAAAARATRTERGRAGRDPRPAGWPAFVALRGPDLPGRRGQVPRDGPRRAADPRCGRGCCGGDTGRAHPRRRVPLRRRRGDPGRLSDARPGGTPRCDAAGPGGTNYGPTRGTGGRDGPGHDRRPRGRPTGRRRTRSRLMDDQDPVWRVVHSRRVVRQFADRPLEPAHLERILRAGRRANSSKNQQRWAFIVCRDREHLRELAKLGPWAGHLAGATVAIALVTPDPKVTDAPLSVMFDLGQAADSMMLVAWELGIGSVPATVYDHDMGQRLLGYPDGYHCEFLLSFGYPTDPTVLTRPLRAGGRRPLGDLVHEERW